MRFHRFFLLLTLPFFCVIAASLAQGQGGSLHGIVMVPSGSPVPGATISIEGKAKGGAQSATTDSNGEYNIVGLTADVYLLKISAAGYEPFELQITVTGSNMSEADAVLMAISKQVEPAQPAVEGPATAPAQAGQPQEQPSAAQMTVAAPQNFSVTAQKGKAAVYGNVSDQSGAVIQGGTATVTGNTGPATAAVNARGQYVLNGLAPGQYKLSVTAPGFASFDTDLTLSADQAVEIDAPLQPAGTQTKVEVVGGGPTEIQTESAHIEGTITEKEVLKTGLNGRNFTQLIALAPGVSNQTGQDEAMVGVKGSVKYSVNGGRVEYNNFDVDGSDVLNAGLNGAESTLMVYPSLDAIQEVKVLTSNYGAMYGRSASGTVLVTTKSGTPHFHGGLYDFVRNEFFNARNYFDETSKAPLYRRQDFGGTIGGPLYIPGVFNTRKDKTYFFWSEEFRLEKTPQEFNQAVPTTPERSGNFSDVCPPPGTVTQAQKEALYPDCGASVVAIGPTAQALLSTGMIPSPNAATGCNSTLAGAINPQTGQPIIPCYDAVISPSTYWREELGRFDHNFTQNLRLSARYIHDSWNTTVATPEWGDINNSFPTVQNQLDGPGTSMVIRLTDTISPSLLNDFVISYVDSHITLADQPAAGVSLQPLATCTTALIGASSPCMNYIFNNSAGGKPPAIVIAGTNAEYGGYGFAVDPSYMPWTHTNPTYSLGDNVSKVLGRHTVQFGVQAVDAQRNETNGAIGAATGDLQGILTFSNENSYTTTGNAFADFLISSSSSQGNIKSYQQDSAQLKYYNDYWIAEPYLQDDWHVNHRLTVNLGLRESIFWNFHEKNLNAYNWLSSQYNPALGQGITLVPWTNPSLPSGYLAKNGVPLPFDPDNPLSVSDPGSALSVVTNGLEQCGVNGVPRSCMSSHLFNSAPRVGFAWDPKGDGKTSIRGGYGVFFEHGTPKEANTGSLEGSSPLVLTMTNPFPTQFSGIGEGCNNSGCGSFVPAAFPIDVTSIPTKTIWPYVQQWSLSVQRQLPKDMVATLAYVGSKGTHLSAELQTNQLPTPPTGPDAGILPSGNPYQPGQPIITATDCQYQNNSNNPDGGFFTVNGISIYSGQPAWKNMVAACFGAKDPFSGVAVQGIPDPNTLRPYFGFRRILSLEDVADSQYHALQATIRRTRGPLTVGGSYTYSHSLDDASDRSDASFVNSANIRSSWASSNFDQRHLLNVNYIYDLPKFAANIERMVSYTGSNPDGDSPADSGPSTPSSPSPFFHALLDGWQISGITVFQSGTPFSVINGASGLGISVPDNAGVANGAGSGSYPDVVGRFSSALPAGVSRFNSQSIGPLLYNPAAFAAPQGLTFGDAGRNYLNNPHRINFDMSLLKNFKVTEGSNMEFRIEGFNVFNHTQFRIFNPNIGNSANNTINCYGGGDGAPYTAAGGYTLIPGSQGIEATQPQPVNCTAGSSFLHPIDAHRPRTIQLGLKYSF